MDEYIRTNDNDEEDQNSGENLKILMKAIDTLHESTISLKNLEKEIGEISRNTLETLASANEDVKSSQRVALMNILKSIDVNAKVESNVSSIGQNIEKYVDNAERNWKRLDKTIESLNATISGIPLLESRNNEFSGALENLATLSADLKYEQDRTITLLQEIFSEVQKSPPLLSTLLEYDEQVVENLKNLVEKLDLSAPLFESIEISGKILSSVTGTNEKVTDFANLLNEKALQIEQFVKASTESTIEEVKAIGNIREDTQKIRESQEYLQKICEELKESVPVSSGDQALSENLELFNQKFEDLVIFVRGQADNQVLIKETLNEIIIKIEENSLAIAKSEGIIRGFHLDDNESLIEKEGVSEVASHLAGLQDTIESASPILQNKIDRVNERLDKIQSSISIISQISVQNKEISKLLLELSGKVETDNPVIESLLDKNKDKLEVLLSAMPILTDTQNKTDFLKHSIETLDGKVNLIPESIKNSIKEEQTNFSILRGELASYSSLQIKNDTFRTEMEEMRANFTRQFNILAYIVLFLILSLGIAIFPLYFR